MNQEQTEKYLVHVIKELLKDLFIQLDKVINLLNPLSK